MNLKQFNELDDKALFQELEKCCGSSTWINAMISACPFVDVKSMHDSSDNNWEKVDEQDILQAFKHHPQIGDVASLKKKFASTASWAGNEQKGATKASDEVLQQLKSANDAYLKRFGFIFIICATGKTAEQMLALLNKRLPNDREKELQIAAAEQNKITYLRLNKLLES